MEQIKGRRKDGGETEELEDGGTEGKTRKRGTTERENDVHDQLAEGRRLRDREGGEWGVCREQPGAR